MLYRAFAFKLASPISEMTTEQLEALSSHVMALVSLLNRRNQPYNLLMRDTVIHIVPRRHESEVPAEVGFGPAIVELFGVFIVKNPELWTRYADDVPSLVNILAEIMRKHVSLS